MIYKLPYDKDLAIKAINIAKEGYICEVKKAKKKRSLNQNSYYWGVVVKSFSQEFGWFEDETHELFGKRFLQYEKNGETLTRSTKDLNTIEFETYMNQCRMYSSDQGHYIPEPNEVTEDYLNQLEAWRI